MQAVSQGTLAHLGRMKVIHWDGGILYTRSVMKKPWFLRGTVLFSGQGAFSSPC
jgi:hypothetical protein